MGRACPVLIYCDNNIFYGKHQFAIPDESASGDRKRTEYGFTVHLSVYLFQFELQSDSNVIRHCSVESGGGE